MIDVSVLYLKWCPENWYLDISQNDTIYCKEDNLDFPNERAGSNDSDKDDYVKGDGWDNFFRLKFKNLLPIGNGQNKIITN